MAKSKKVVIREEFKKNVGAIHTSGELSLLERKMSNILLLNAYDSLPTAKSHSIPVAHLCAMLGWEESNNVERLKDALRTLVSTRIEFNLLDKEGKEHWEVTTIISGGNIGNGICTYRYDSELAKKLYHPSVYATINIGIQRRFSGNYALTLYENCVRFRNNGPESGTGFIPIDKFRKLMGAENVAYEDYKYLKRDVIKKSVDEINKVSDIEIELVEERGKGRKVTAVKFLVKENPQLSLFEREIPENFGEMRKDETYRKLRGAGIGERLALSMILNDPKRAKEVLEYAAERAGEGRERTAERPENRAEGA